jgi:hypothetical protein
MNKTLLLLFAALPGLSACGSKDEPPAPQTDPLLLGTWTRITQTETTTYKDGRPTSSFTYTPPLGSIETLAFTSQGTAITAYGLSSRTDPYTYVGNILTIKWVNQPAAVLTVTVLTSKRLVTTRSEDNASSHYEYSCSYER